jgi:isopentenyl-diphosphate delta-isomerase
MTEDKIVSFDDELLICVDEYDHVIDYRTKDECHQGHGILHRAFSIFIFNDNRQLILQKRSEKKLLWPLFWSNSCCSHPRKGESIESAAVRRLEEELNIKTELTYLYTFRYQASFADVGSENEMCAVFIGRSDQPVKVNANEIAEWQYIDQDDLTADMSTYPEKYTPWFKMEWEKLASDFAGQLRKI